MSAEDPHSLRRDTLDGASVVRDSAAGSGSGDRDAAPDPKPEARIVATRSEWETIRRLKLFSARCRVCGTHAATLHHLVPRSLGGDDLIANLIPVCGDGTRGCHGLIEHKAPGTLDLVRRSLLAEEVDYVLAKKGPGFLERYYPHKVWPGP